MQEVELTISKSKVYHEVAKLTSYIGSKSVTENDPDAYRRVFATDASRELLEQYWSEACSGVTASLRPWLAAVTEHGYSHHPDLSADYRVKLRMPSTYDSALTGSVETSLSSHVMLGIASKWLLITDPSRSTSYGEQAASSLTEALSKLYHRKAPART